MLLYLVDFGIGLFAIPDDNLVLLFYVLDLGICLLTSLESKLLEDAFDIIENSQHPIYIFRGIFLVPGEALTPRINLSQLIL